MTKFSDSTGGPQGTNPLLDYFITNTGNIIHKWVDYFDIYHRAFAIFRDRPITFLEIGVQNGGSLAMWREYFGPNATIIGVDIDPECKALEKKGFEIWIGDQSDREFWAEFLHSHPELDVILDDGGHTMAQQIATFECLFPALNQGGVYFCEDVHSSYLPPSGGGLAREGTFIEYVKNLIHGIHGWYHLPIAELPHAYMMRNLYAISIYDSVIVMEKRLKNPPIALVRGSAGHFSPPAAMDHLDLRRVCGVPDLKS